MRKFLFILPLLALACSTEKSAEKATEPQAVNWPEGGVAYEIFVQSFADSDGDGIGDIPGMTEKLDYVKELGADAIWLMPIMESPSYHKYDVTDYRSIHPDYGNMEDFKAFVREAHKREIKVIIDFIINHTSSEHPWFKNAKTGPDAEYRDFYVWADRDSIAEQIAKKETSFDSDNITQWHAVDGDTTSEHYYGFFYGGMPDLNYDNPVVRKEVYDIGKYWLQEVGVDGFRMDAAKHIYPDDRPEDNHAFWAEFKSEMEKVKSDVYVVGEVWANTETQTPYIKGFSALFDFDLAFSILETAKKGQVTKASISGHGWSTDSSGSFVDKIIHNKKAYDKVNDQYVNAIFLSNHDQNRAMSVLENDVDKAKLAAAIMFTLPGTPYIYYGEEIGMRGMKPDPNIREPFLWKPKNDDDNRATWIEPKFTTGETVTPLSEQKQSKTSIFNHYKSLIATRKANTALTEGTIKPVKQDNSSLLVFERQSNDQKLLVIHNLSGTKQSFEFESGADVLFGKEGWLENSVVNLPPFKFVVLSLL